jgi:DNA-binding response OmpR family regulator
LLPAPGPDQGSILVVDDDPEILETVTAILEFEGYDVLQAHNGAEALALIERRPPALVLLDMRMPVLNGWDFARLLHARHLSVPILVMTAAQEAGRWAAEIGADGYVAKPFHITDLLKQVARFVDQPGEC